MAIVLGTAEELVLKVAACSFHPQDVVVQVVFFLELLDLILDRSRRRFESWLHIFYFL